MMVLRRVALPLLNSFLITAALFGFMYSLIFMKDPELAPSVTLPVIKFNDIPEDPEVEVIAVKPKAPELISEQPDTPRDAVIDIEPIDGPQWSEPVLGPTGGAVLLPSDNQLVIALGFPPEYPHRAVTRGIEGYAVVGFSVSSAGDVFDPYILESEPKGYFEKSSLKAIKKFRYRPRTVGGKPVATDGQRYMFTYKLDQG